MHCDHGYLLNDICICDVGYFGIECTKRCLNGIIRSFQGVCICIQGWSGEECDQYSFLSSIYGEGGILNTFVGFLLLVIFFILLLCTPGYIAKYICCSCCRSSSPPLTPRTPNTTTSYGTNDFVEPRFVSDPPNYDDALKFPKPQSNTSFTESAISDASNPPPYEVIVVPS